MTPCCLEESRRNLKRHRDVATCDGCGALLLAYGVEADFRSVLGAFQESGVTSMHARLGDLWVVAKPPQGGAAGTG